MALSLSLALAVAMGVAIGVFGDPIVAPLAPWALALGGLVSLLAGARQARRVASLGSHFALVAVSIAVAGSAEDRALHSPLRTLLEQRVGGFSIDEEVAVGIAGPMTIEGRLRSDAAPTETGATLTLDVERVWIAVCPEPAAGGVLLSVTGSLTASAVNDWRAGRTLRLAATLRRPARYLDVGVPDQERQLARRGISLVGSVKSAALVDVVDRGRWFEEAASGARSRVRAAMARHIGARDAQSGAIATAILIGDRAALDPAIETRLQEAGTYHVIAISGGNIAIVAGVLLAGLWWIGVGGSWAAAIAILSLAAYAVVVGGGASVVRATLMAAIYLALRAIDQRTAPSHAVAVTVAAVLLATPLSIADVGFWLTFGATAAIVAAAARVPLRVRWSRMPAALVVASIAAEVALMPIGALVFQRVTIAGPLLNLAAVPCMGLVQLAAMLTVAADVVGAMSIAAVAGWTTHLGAQGLIESARLVDLAPWATWRVAPPSMAAVLVYYAAIVVWYRASRGVVDTRGRQLAARVAMATGSALFLWIAVAPPTLARHHGDGRLRLTVLDVGQGDAMLLDLPNGRRVMVDAGGVSARGAFDVGDRVVGPALRARGVTSLDYLAITHGDPDHIGGAVALMRAFSPGEVWEGVPVANHEPSVRLHLAAARERAAWRNLQSGDRLQMGGVELRVHHPEPPDWERQQVRNDDSIVVELRFGQVSMLLTGDIGHDVERQIIRQLDLLPLVVLKAPHHGSGTSSSPEFVQAVKPDIVLVSCGRGNPYGHPVPYVLARYHDAGAQIFRTDLEGQIDVETDGESLTVETFTGRRLAIR